MSILLEKLAELLGAEIIGDPALEIRRVVHPSRVESEHDLALAYSEKVRPLVEKGGILTALVPKGVDVPGIPNQLKVDRPRVALSHLLRIFDRPPHVDAGIHPAAFVHESAQVADGVSIGPGCVVGPRTIIAPGSRLISGVNLGADVEVGEDCLFFAGVTIGDRVRLGDRVVVKANAAIGNDGFSFQTVDPGSAELILETGEVQPTESATLRINSVGTVVIGDDVEVGACVCIDRGTLHETRIGNGTKIDNLVQIAHNVEIGVNGLIVAQVGIAGSATIGKRAVIAGQVGIPDHVTIGDDVAIMPQSGVIADIPSKSYVGGSPAVPRMQYLHEVVQLRRLKYLVERVDDLEARLKAHEQF